MKRSTVVERTTHDTKIKIEANLDGTGKYDIKTGIGFFDHMLEQMARNGFLDLSVQCTGDLKSDTHHTIENVGISLGMAFSLALGNKEGISRYGFKIVPMDESLALCAVDFSGRPFLGFNVPFTVPRLGDFDTETIEEFFRAFTVYAGCTLHIKMISGGNNHHMAEAVFKAAGQAISQAIAIDPRISVKI